MKCIGLTAFLLMVLATCAFGQRDWIPCCNELSHGSWSSSKYLDDVVVGDTVILTRSDGREWKFRANGNVKGPYWVSYCGRVPKWRRNEDRWGKVGTWRIGPDPSQRRMHLTLFPHEIMLERISADNDRLAFLAIDVQQLDR
jgi:hypothetical protein